MAAPNDDKILTKERILYAAKTEFAEKGFSGARMGAIAKRANANQALLHYYFNSKENLYQEVIYRLFGLDQTGYIHEFIDSKNLDPVESLFAIIYFMTNLHLYVVDPDLNRIVSRETAEDRTEIRTLITEYFVPRLFLMEQIIQKGIDSGVFEAENPLFVIFGFISIILFFESNREHYNNTDFFDKLYSDKSKSDFIKYVSTQTFKTLTPIGKPVKLPVINESLIQELDALIENIKTKRSWKV